jgi:hypothetical protein
MMDVERKRKGGKQKKKKGQKQYSIHMCELCIWLYIYKYVRKGYIIQK